jgi:DUF438 domain-containing protein
MNNNSKFSEEKRIIGTSRYVYFQQMCSEAGLFAIKEAKDRNLPITYVDKEEIIKEYADGKKETLGKAKPNIKVKYKVYKIP